MSSNKVERFDLFKNITLSFCLRIDNILNS